MALSNEYTILIDPKLEKSIKKNLPKYLKKALDRKLDFLSRDVFHNSLNCKKMNVSSTKLSQLGVKEVYEFRINMGYRCVLYLRNEDKQLIVAFVGDHKQIKNKLK